MARHQHDFDSLINSINNETFVDNFILFRVEHLNQQDIDALCLAFNNKTQIAAQIIQIRISGNNLKNIIVPQTLINLETLILDNNGLFSVKIATSLTRLKHLDLDANYLTNLSIPSNLTNIECIFLDNNLIKNIFFPLGITKNCQVYIQDNPLSIATKISLRAYQELHPNISLKYDAAYCPVLSIDIMRNSFHGKQHEIAKTLANKYHDILQDQISHALFLALLPCSLPNKIIEHILSFNLDLQTMHHDEYLAPVLLFRQYFNSKPSSQATIDKYLHEIEGELKLNTNLIIESVMKLPRTRLQIINSSSNKRLKMV